MAFEGSIAMSAKSSIALPESATNTGPVGGVLASWKARRITDGTCSGVRYFGTPFGEWCRHVCQIAASSGEMPDVLVACSDYDWRASAILIDHQTEAVG